jgi:transposase
MRGVSDPREQLIALLQQQNDALRALVSQQQTLIEHQRELIATLERKLGAQAAEHAERAAQLEAQVKRLTRELLGPKTEKIPPAERDLGDEEPTEEDLARRREEIARKRRERALAKAAAMPTEEVEHPVPDGMRICPKCHGTRFSRLGDETSTSYEYVPGRFVRRRHRRQKLACSCGEHIVVAPAPPKLVPGGQYGFGFAAFLVVEKCGDSIPIYRIEKRLGVAPL